ncbi:thiamine phosphate synthase [Nocardioides gansuensis]|uniref:thiamine phosphate synthase n=1 Tax=Nocardioides gansuensis TaxID=2138300 RepID=UPI001403BA25|nr:thiamine phosphate synthase [Nocardioides gansuensis]
MPAKEVIFVLPRLFCLVSSTDDLALLPALAGAGVEGFQVRDKSATTAELVDLTRVVLDAVAPYGARVVVNDRVDVALATGAAGVHLGADDLPVAAARRLAPDLLIGATCRDGEAVRRAAEEGASYAGFGPVARSGSKAGLPEPLGTRALGEAAGPLPLVAIGGVDAQVARAAREAGAHGVAVIAAVWRHPDPIAAAKELVRAVA